MTAGLVLGTWYTIMDVNVNTVLVIYIDTKRYLLLRIFGKIDTELLHHYGRKCKDRFVMNIKIK